MTVFVLLTAAGPHPEERMLEKNRNNGLLGMVLTEEHQFLFLSPRPVGFCRATRPVWGGGAFCPSPKISRTTQRSDKRQTALDSPGRELSIVCIFFENRGHGSGQTEVKGQILLFLLRRLLRPNTDV